MTGIMSPIMAAESQHRGSAASVFGDEGWQQRLAQIVEMMREMSLQDDPQAMVRTYGRRVRKLMPGDRWISLSRRGLEPPQYRITRSSTWTEEINPWKEKDRLPLLEGGLLGELIYGDEPRIIDDIAPLLKPDDPAYDYLAGFRSLMAIPHYDHGVGAEHGRPRCRRSPGPSIPRSSPSGSGSAACSAGRPRTWS